MLPPGHIAAGYLVSKALSNKPSSGIPAKQKKLLAWWGMALAFLPDIDTLYAFYKSSGFTINPAVANHRVYLTHTPVLWLAAGLMVFVLAKRPCHKAIGLLVWLASWSHFLLDSIDYGVRWLWPFDGRFLALVSSASGSGRAADSGFMRYWLGFLSAYTHSVTFYIEAIIIAVALIVFIKSYILNTKS